MEVKSNKTNNKTQTAILRINEINIIAISSIGRIKCFINYLILNFVKWHLKNQWYGSILKK